MPKRKKKSHEMKRLQIKLKRRKIKEEEMKKLQELQLINNQIDGNDELNATQAIKTEEFREDQPAISRIAKHAEYVRNYRKNMSEERKKAARAVAAWRMAQRRKTMSEEKKAAIRAADRLRIAFKRKNMSEEDKLAQREYHRQRMAFKRKNMSEEERNVFRENQRRRMALKRQSMTEEQKLAAREADRRRVAMKRKKWKEQSEHFRGAMLRLALQRQNFLPPPVDLTDSSDDDAPEDIQRSEESSSVDVYFHFHSPLDSDDDWCDR